MGTLSVPSTTFIDLGSVTDAEVISNLINKTYFLIYPISHHLKNLKKKTNISPAIGVHVEVLDVSHLGVAESSGCASSASSMMDNYIKIIQLWIH